MLKADSRALNSDRDDQSRATPPMIPSVAALSWTRWTRVRMLFERAARERALSSLTRKSDASARCARPSNESARKTSGTNESNAKYATIAARWVPRSAKNFATEPACGGRTRCRRHRASLRYSLRPDGRSSGARRSDRDLVADRGRRPLRRGRRSPARRSRTPAAAAFARGARRAARARRGRSGRRRGGHAARGLDARGQRLRRPGRCAPDRCDHRPEPTVGLVFYDLKSCLRGSAPAPPKPRAAAARRKKVEADGEA